MAVRLAAREGWVYRVVGVLGLCGCFANVGGLPTPTLLE